MTTEGTHNNFANDLRMKAVAIFKQLPNVVRIDPHCYTYHNIFAYFAWAKYQKVTIPFMLQITSKPTSDLQGHNCFYEFAVQQLYCRYLSRDYFIADLLNTTNLAKTDHYFNSGYSIENIRNIYIEPETYQDNYLADTDFIIGEFLHYLDTWPIDSATNTRQIMQLTGHEVKTIPDLTIIDLSDILKNSTMITLTTHVNQVNADVFFIQVLQYAMTSLLTNIKLSQLDLNDLYRQCFHGNVIRQAVATYQNQQPAIICQFTFQNIIQIEVYKDDGNLIDIMSWQLAGSILDLLKLLTLRVKDNGLLVIK